MRVVAPDGSCEVGFEYDGQPNGMKFLTDGRLLVADHHKGMVLCDPKTAKSEPWFDRYLLEPFLGCNDLTIAKNGDIWFTDQGQSGWHNPNGRLFRVRAGSDRLELMLDGIPSPHQSSTCVNIGAPLAGSSGATCSMNWQDNNGGTSEDHDIPTLGCSCSVWNQDGMKWGQIDGLTSYNGVSHLGNPGTWGHSAQTSDGCIHVYLR